MTKLAKFSGMSLGWVGLVSQKAWGGWRLVFGEGVGRVFYLFYASGKVDGSDSHVVDRLSIYIYNIYIYTVYNIHM